MTTEHNSSDQPHAPAEPAEAEIPAAIDRRSFLGMMAAGMTRVAGQVRARRPAANEFVFARLRYDSGDWDYNPKVAANVLDSVVQYTTIPVYP